MGWIKIPERTPIFSSYIFLRTPCPFLGVTASSFSSTWNGGHATTKRNSFLRNCSSRSGCFRSIILLQVQKLFLGNTATIISERQVSGNCYFSIYRWTNGSFLSHLPITEYPLCSKYWAGIFMAYKDVQDKVLVFKKNVVIGLGWKDICMQK